MSRILKGLNVLLLSACAAGVASAKGVDEQTARKVGYNQLISVGASGISAPGDLETAYVATSQSSFGVTVDYYVFNIHNGRGFVMVAADDAIIPILAYSTESSFDINGIAPATKDWIDGYKNEINASITSGYTAGEATAAKWNSLLSATGKKAAAKTTTVSKLVNSTWDQMPFYNNNTPVPGGSSSATPTGCVATSIAQVMRYWGWPSRGCGFHTYKPSTYSARTADFDTTVYNWSATSMPLTSSSTNVAKLMSDVGIAVEMNYAPGESGAYTTIPERLYASGSPTVAPGINCSEYALKTYFHYKKSIHSELRYDETSGGSSTIGTGTWTAMLKGDLDKKMPILYSGQGASGGHAWVCDGYDASNNFHFNWGWSGASDGYFTVDNLNPPSLGVGGGGGNFNYYQAVIMGIEPDSFAKATNNMMLAAHLDIQTNMPAAYPVGACALVTKVVNSNTAAFKGDFCVQIFDDNLKYYTTMATLTGQSIAAGGTLPLTIATTTSSYMLIPGIYKLRLLFRTSSSAPWTLVGDNGVYVNENQLMINTSQDLELASNIVSSTGVMGVRKGSTLTINASVANNTPSTFNGSVKCVFVNVSSGAMTDFGATVSEVLSGYSASSTYAFASPSVTLTPGIYSVAVQHKLNSDPAFIYTGSDYYVNPVIFTVSTGGVGINNVTLSAENINVYPNPASDIININMHDEAVSRITVTDIRGSRIQEITPDGFQKVVSVPVNNYAPGIYFVNLFSGDDVVTKKIVVAK